MSTKTTMCTRHQSPSNTQLSTLESLPDELLDLILSHLPSRTTLHTLTLVSRHLNRLATAHLYTHITLYGADFKYLRPLALLFWTSPAHRQLVRSFSVVHAYGGNLDPWPKCEGLDLDAVIRGNVECFVRRSDWGVWVEEVSGVFVWRVCERFTDGVRLCFRLGMAVIRRALRVCC